MLLVFYSLLRIFPVDTRIARHRRDSALVVQNETALFPHWGYDDSDGPSHWPVKCRSGRRQSPIDIDTRQVKRVDVESLRFANYDRVFDDIRAENNGHSIVFVGFDRDPATAPYVEGGGLPGRYILQQFHFHWSHRFSNGSEHTINRHHYPVEVHMVHVLEGRRLTDKENDSVAVLAVFGMIGEDGVAFENIAHKFPDFPGDRLTTKFRPSLLLPSDTSDFFSYDGSLTTPGCLETVAWILFHEPIPVTVDQGYNCVHAMVLREAAEHEDFYLKIDGKWILVDEKLLSAHPGGSVITTYRNKDATTVFHTFHANSKSAYKMLADTVAGQRGKIPPPNISPPTKKEIISGIDDVNMGEYNLTPEQIDKMCKNFDKLRIKVRNLGLLNGKTSYFVRKFFEAVGLIALAVFLQSRGFYVISALLLGLAWQQLGWMIHEYCHHQHFKNHFWNDAMSYVVGNFMQGFSSGGWKEQHNVHHAATNVVGRDGDLDLMPFWATVASDLKLIDENSPLWQVIPYQHLYWTLGLPLLRISWLIQTISFVSKMDSSFYDIHRRRARVEQITLAAHWIFVLTQLYFLPSFQIRLTYFLVSQLFGGFLLAHVVTYNHYSTDKFPYDAAILENYACLQLYTTRNMRPGLFIDWLWGGLNYQIEHHLFPTMPRSNLKKVMPLVKEFCVENDLPYMVDDYFTGWKYEIEQFERVARVARKLITKSS